jgi:predicted nucleic acid-binding protein
MACIYLDTSFFMGALENQKGHREEARRIIRYEEENKNSLHTSILTINEFVIKTYNTHRKSEDCEQRVDATIQEILQIASVYGMSEEIVRRAALIQSVWGEVYGQLHPDQPRDRKFRWDALHLATAHALRAERVYAWDDKWLDVPKEAIPQIGEIITPAKCPQTSLPTEQGEATASSASASASASETEPPSEQSPAAPQE